MAIDAGPDVERPLLAVKVAGFPSVGATVLESLVGGVCGSVQIAVTTDQDAPKAGPSPGAHP